MVCHTDAHLCKAMSGTRQGTICVPELRHSVLRERGADLHPPVQGPRHGRDSGRAASHVCSGWWHNPMSSFEPMLAVLRGNSVDEVCIALEALGCWHHDAARLSLGALKHTLRSLCLVALLRRDDAAVFPAGCVRCSCGNFCKDCQCSHEGYIRAPRSAAPAAAAASLHDKDIAGVCGEHEALHRPSRECRSWQQQRLEEPRRYGSQGFGDHQTSEGAGPGIGCSAEEVGAEFGPARSPAFIGSVRAPRGSDEGVAKHVLYQACRGLPCRPRTSNHACGGQDAWIGCTFRQNDEGHESLRCPPAGKYILFLERERCMQWHT